MGRITSMTVILAALLGVAGCTVISGYVHEALDRPALNPKARDVLRITVISKTDANIRLRAGFYTQNPECKVQKSPTAPKVGHVKYDVFDVPTRKEGAVIEVLLDKYEPGRCHWGFGGLYVNAIVPGAGDSMASLLAFSSDGLVPSKPLSIICREYPRRELNCKSGSFYDDFLGYYKLRDDVREVTFETRPYQERPSK